jgi:hypothetical protein
VWKPIRPSSQSIPHPRPPPTTSAATNSVAKRNAIPVWVGGGRVLPAARLVWRSSSRLPRSRSLSGSDVFASHSQKAQKTGLRGWRGRADHKDVVLGCQERQIGFK